MKTSRKTLIVTESELKQIVKTILNEAQMTDIKSLSSREKRAISALGSVILDLKISSLEEAEGRFEDVMMRAGSVLPTPLKNDLQNLTSQGFDLVGAAWQNAESRGVSRPQSSDQLRDDEYEHRKLPKYFGAPEDSRSSM